MNGSIPESAFIKKVSTWHAPLGVIVQPPAVGQAESERQEVRLGRQLVGDDDAALAQQRLQTGAHRY